MRLAVEQIRQRPRSAAGSEIGHAAPRIANAGRPPARIARASLRDAPARIAPAMRGWIRTKYLRFLESRPGEQVITGRRMRIGQRFPASAGLRCGGGPHIGRCAQRPRYKIGHAPPGGWECQAAGRAGCRSFPRQSARAREATRDQEQASGFPRFRLWKTGDNRSGQALGNGFRHRRGSQRKGSLIYVHVKIRRRRYT